MSFTKKIIEARIDLENGGGGLLTGHPMECTIEKVGLPDKNKATIVIYGLNYEILDRMTIITQALFAQERNKIEISAGDDGRISRIFVGDIISSFADFSTVPDPVLRIEAQTGVYASCVPEDPETVVDAEDADKVVQKIAGRTGLEYVPQMTGASTLTSPKIENTVLQGSPWDKMSSVADQIDAELIIDDDTVMLLGQKGYRIETNPVDLSVESGLLGFPSITHEGISCRSLFNPNIIYGALLNLRCENPPKAAGQWRITKVVHNLSAFLSGNTKWETQLEAVRLVGGMGGL